MTKKFLLIAAVILTVTSACMADVITLTDGRVVKGRMVDESSERIGVEGELGISYIPRSMVKSIDKTPSAYEMYFVYKVETKEDDMESRKILAKWCKNNGLPNKYREEVLNLAEDFPDDEDICAWMDELGYTMLKGKWVRKEIPKAQKDNKAKPKSVPKLVAKKKPTNKGNGSGNVATTKQPSQTRQRTFPNLDVTIAQLQEIAKIRLLLQRAVLLQKGKAGNIFSMKGG
ncbi:hypothetical protein HY605_04315 [Candidatus Peregrinibacteria bacterium]|nr:hypothetical protein [Candidatus Peregrinibacteria bacterium]